MHLAALTAAWLVVAACNPGGGGSRRFDVFPLGFFPVALSGADSASLAFDRQGDLWAAAGEDSVFRLLRSDGSLEEFDLSTDPVCGGAGLVAVIVDRMGVLLLGADDGRIFRLEPGQGCSQVADLGDEPVTGLALAPGRFVLPRGTLIAAAGSDGVFAVELDEQPPVISRVTPVSADAYVDVVFAVRLLLALNASSGEVVRLDIEEAGQEASLEMLVDGIVGGVGLAVNEDEVVVADAGAGALRSAPILEDDPELADIAPYSFAAQPPGGLALDGTGTLAIATPGSVIVRAFRLPPLIVPNFGALIEGPSVGYGDMEFDDEGNLLLVATDEGDPGDPDQDIDPRPPENFLFRVDHEGFRVDELERGVGSEGERLLALARDPFAGELFLGSDLGNVFRRIGRGDLSLISVLGSGVLGLEWAPEASAFTGQLVATTELGDVVAVDPASGAQTPIDNLGATLPDLVFGVDGTLYVVDSETPAIWSRPDGGAFAMLASGSALGLPDGIAIDEGGARLLVASDIDPETDQLLEVTLGGAVRALVDIDIDDGFFPTGVVYDGLSRAAVRIRDQGTAVGAFEVPFPL